MLRLHILISNMLIGNFLYSWVLLIMYFDMFGITLSSTPVKTFPKSKDEVITSLLMRRKNEAQKLWISDEEYEKIRMERKIRAIRSSNTIDEDKIIQIKRYECSNWIKMGKITFLSASGLEASAYILKSWQDKPFFGWNYENMTSVEKEKIRKIAFAHFDWTI